MELSEERLLSRIEGIEHTVERRHSEMAVILASLVKQTEKTHELLQAGQGIAVSPCSRKPIVAASGSSSSGNRRPSLNRSNPAPAPSAACSLSGSSSALPTLATLAATSADLGASHDADSFAMVKEMWSLVETDDSIQSMLKEIREKVDRRALADRQSMVAARMSGVDDGSSGGRLPSTARHCMQATSGLARALSRATSSGRFASSSDGGTPNGRGGGVRWELDEGSSSRRRPPYERGRYGVLRAVMRLHEGFHNLCTGMGPVMHPDSRFRTGWNVFLALLICYCGIAVPLEIAFERDLIISMCQLEGTASNSQVVLTSISAADGRCPSYLFWFIFQIFVDLFFVIDIFLNFRTGYSVEGHFVSDPVLAARRYFFGSFCIDFLGSFPLSLILYAVQSSDGGDGSVEGGRANRVLRLFRMTKLAKLARLVKLKSYLQYLVLLIRFNPALLRIFQLFLWALFCCHWFGCLWWLVADMELTFPEDFISVFQLASDTATAPNASRPIGAPLYSTAELTAMLEQINIWVPAQSIRASPDFALKYGHSFFWGAGFVTSMVPKDVEPYTSIETYLTTLLMFCGLLLNAVVISSFASAFASMDSKKELAGKQLDTIRNYLIVKNVPADLRARILEYYEYKMTSSQSLFHAANLRDMPPHLSAQLALSVNRRIVASSASFFCDVSNAALVCLLEALMPEVFVPGQVIVSEGSTLRYVFFINKGVVQLLTGMGTESEQAAAAPQPGGIVRAVSSYLWGAAVPAEANEPE